MYCAAPFSLKEGGSCISTLGDFFLGETIHVDCKVTAKGHEYVPMNFPVYLDCMDEDDEDEGLLSRGSPMSDDHNTLVSSQNV